MNTKSLLNPKSLFFFLAAAHLLLIFGSRFFISPEFTLYPYFVSRGLLPYVDIIDQHFPLLLFGPLNLAQLGLITPTSTTLLFATVILATDLGAYLSLRKTGSKHPTFFLLLFILSQLLLGGDTLWLESFSLLLLTWATYFLQTRPGPRRDLILGLLLGSAALLRPSQSFFIALVFLMSIRFKQLLYLSVVPLLSFVWLQVNHLWQPFINLFSFNFEYYAASASQPPSFRQLFIVGLISLLVLLTSSRPFKALFALILLLPAALPRFELIHLFPITTLFIISPAKKIIPGTLTLTGLLLGITLYTRLPFGSNNYFYSANLEQLTIQLEDQVVGNAYFFGGPDQLYVTTNTLPPDNFYLPSLPWYHQNPEFVEKQIQALKNSPSTPVIFNPNSTVDDTPIRQYAHEVYDYLQANYTLVKQTGDLEVYLYSQSLAGNNL